MHGHVWKWGVLPEMAIEKMMINQGVECGFPYLDLKPPVRDWRTISGIYRLVIGAAALRVEILIPLVCTGSSGVWLIHQVCSEPLECWHLLNFRTGSCCCTRQSSLQPNSHVAAWCDLVSYASCFSVRSRLAFDLHWFQVVTQERAEGRES